MSPRAAWRLEAIGYPEVYDYVAGKSDWMAAGLPTERSGDHPPRVAEVMDRSVPTCEPTEVVADVMGRLGPSGAQVCVVVNEHGVVQGRLRLDRLDPADSRPADEAMEPGPTTIRADADLAQTTERMRRRSAPSLIVSDPDGILLGAVHVEAIQEQPRLGAYGEVLTVPHDGFSRGPGGAEQSLGRGPEYERDRRPEQELVEDLVEPE
jgi:CBS domain-containing protein